MGLLGGVFDDSEAVSQDGGQHDIHGGPHRDDIQIYLAAGQTGAIGHPGVDEAVAHLHLGPHGDKALDMLVHRPAAQIAAAGQGNLRPAEPAQQSAHEVIAGADFPGQLIGNLAVADVGAIHLDGSFIDDADIRA